jgi:hypothetical protein
MEKGKTLIFAGAKIDPDTWRVFSSWAKASGKTVAEAMQQVLHDAVPPAFRKVAK